MSTTSTSVRRRVKPPVGPGTVQYWYLVLYELCELIALPANSDAISLWWRALSITDGKRMTDYSDQASAAYLGDEIQAIIAALVGGVRYGTKIRLPHALVMTFLFRRDLSAQEKIRSIIRMTMLHASNLGLFAVVYKVRVAM